MTNSKIMFTNKTKSLLLSGIIALTITSCKDKHNDPGTEFAANMYHSVGYEPLSQSEGDTNRINPHGMNMRLPVKGTVPRKYVEKNEDEDVNDALIEMDLIARGIKSGDMASSEQLLTNPFEPTGENFDKGKEQYERFCQHCHGELGKGDGAVAKMYKGVPVYSSDALKDLNDGHIYHTITHGKGRMWAHGSQISSADRWKIVLYVHELQKQ
jgi:cytochrome c553